MCIPVGTIPRFEETSSLHLQNRPNLCNKSNCSYCYNPALTKAVFVLAKCVGRTAEGARTIKNIVTLTLTNKKWNYFMTEAGLVKPLDL